MAQDETDWDEIRRRNVRSSQRAPEWPERVKSLSLDGLALLGIDDQHRLYWDGRPVEVRRRLDLTFWQKIAVLWRKSLRTAHCAYDTDSNYGDPDIERKRVI